MTFTINAQTILLALGTLIAACGIPAALTKHWFWRLEKNIQDKEKEDKKEREARQKQIDERENSRKEFDLMMIEGINSAIVVTEATAKAVQRIPDAHCNGDMTSALQVTKDYKAKQKSFIRRQAVENLHFDYD